MNTIFKKQDHPSLAHFFAAAVFVLLAAFSFSNRAFAAAPAAPTSVTATAGNGAATVSFTPDPTNCAPITPCTYTVSMAGLFGSIGSTQGSSSPIQMSGLSNGTAYTFTVTATNMAGTSPASSPSNSVTPVAAGTTAGGGSTTTGGTNAISISIPLQNPIPSTSTIPAFIANILNAVVLLLTPVVVIMIIYAGFLFVTAVGDTEKLKQAKSTLLYAVIGAAIVLGAKGFAIVIQNAINCLAGSTGC